MVSFQHLTNSPNLALLDDNPFPDLKMFLGEKRFESKKQLKHVTIFFRDPGTQLYVNDTNKLISRFKKCIVVDGDYVKK